MHIINIHGMIVRIRKNQTMKYWKIAYPRKFPHNTAKQCMHSLQSKCQLVAIFICVLSVKLNHNYEMLEDCLSEKVSSLYG